MHGRAMFRTLLACLTGSLLLAGCANGWPTARHPGPSTVAAAGCVPTTSKIARHDCTTTSPGGQTSGGDWDREAPPVQSGSVATFTPH